MASDESLGVVPFGKYRGQPIEVLANDRAYCDWLMGQGWFRERFGGIHTLIVNNFAAPTETPEHNALQARFLNPDWCERFAMLLGIRATLDRMKNRLIEDWQRAGPHLQRELERRQQEIDRTKRALERRQQEVDRAKQEVDRAKQPDKLAQATERVVREQVAWYEKDAAEAVTREAELRAAIINDYPARVAGLTWTMSTKTEFEVEGKDVVLSVVVWSTDSKFPVFDPSWHNTHYEEVRFDATWSVECKPILGDDYPAVLRQMKANRSSVLLLEEFRSSAITLEQLRLFFGRSKFRVVMVADVEAVPALPRRQITRAEGA